MSRRKKKPILLKKHFQMRCIERIGFPINNDLLKKNMMSGKLSLSWRESNTITHWDVPSWMLPNGFTKKIEAVYDSARHEFVTVLFKNQEDYVDNMVELIQERKRI